MCEKIKFVLFVLSLTSITLCTFIFVILYANTLDSFLQIWITVIITLDVVMDIAMSIFMWMAISYRTLGSRLFYGFMTVCGIWLCLGYKRHSWIGMNILYLVHIGKYAIVLLIFMYKNEEYENEDIELLTHNF